MRLGQLQQILEEADFPTLTSRDEGARLYRFVLESGVRDILELGFAHGTSTTYMAAGLEQRGEGCITTIDRESAREREPNIHTLLEQTGLGSYVEPVFAATSYNWELMKIIRRQSTAGATVPCFDFCFLDGAHSWETDGLAFFLVEKLLRPGGWILFDDVHWTFASSAGLQDTDQVRAMPEDERTSPQVMMVLSLLAMQHPTFTAFHVHRNWAWVGKAGVDGAAPPADALVASLTESGPAAAV